MDLRFLDQQYDVTNQPILMDDGRWACFSLPTTRSGYQLIAMLKEAKERAELAAEAEANLRALIDGLFENEVKP